MTTFFLKHDIDTGDIISRTRIDVGPDEDAGSVHDRLMEIGAHLTVETVEHIIKGDLKTTPQSELCGDTEPTPAPKIFKEDCLTDWSRDAAAIHNHVRGLAPYPSAWSHLSLQAEGDDTGTVKIIKTAHATAETGLKLKPGELALCGKRAYAGTGDGKVLELVTVQPAGKKPMGGADFLRGLRIAERGLSPHLK